MFFFSQLGKESNEVRAVGVNLTPLARMQLFRNLDNELLTRHTKIPGLATEFLRAQGPTRGDSAFRSGKWKEWILTEAGESTSSSSANSKNLFLNAACCLSDELWTKFEKVVLLCSNGIFYMYSRVCVFAFVGPREIGRGSGYAPQQRARKTPKETQSNQRSQGDWSQQGRKSAESSCPTQ